MTVIGSHFRQSSKRSMTGSNDFGSMRIQVSTYKMVRTCFKHASREKSSQSSSRRAPFSLSSWLTNDVTNFRNFCRRAIGKRLLLLKLGTNVALAMWHLKCCLCAYVSENIRPWSLQKYTLALAFNRLNLKRSSKYMISSVVNSGWHCVKCLSIRLAFSQIRHCVTSSNLARDWMDLSLDCFEFMSSPLLKRFWWKALAIRTWCREPCKLRNGTATWTLVFAIKIANTVEVDASLLRKRRISGVFDRRFSEEKSPTITVARFFSFFFRQTTISFWLVHFSYIRNYENYYHKAKSGQRKLVQKAFPFQFYFLNVTYKTGRD